MATRKTVTIPPSATGYFVVTLTRSFAYLGFNFVPGPAITVDRSTLDAMTAESGLVSHVRAAD